MRQGQAFTSSWARRYSSIAPRLLSPGTLNPGILKVRYAIRGELAIKADEYQEKIRASPENHGLPFSTITTANIGNPQQAGLDQKPITFGRQVAALMEYPALTDLAKDIFPSDVIARARQLRDEIGSIGAYSHCQGVPFIRKSVAKFIEQRDGYPANPSHIFLTAGASAGASIILNMLIASVSSGVLIPIPQYPLYSATLAQRRGVPIPYYLDETKGWSTEPAEVERAVVEAKAKGTDPKALVVVNPGNPTGSLLDYETQRELVNICAKHNLVILADEVYQTNLHDPENHPFTSFKKVVMDSRSDVALISFHSISKGVTGECGRRGGYFECANVPEDVVALIYKMVALDICPPVSGQIGVDCLVRPPVPGEPSYELWKNETYSINAALAKRTNFMAERFNKLPGVTCAPAPGALYLFPRLHLPPAAIQAAKDTGQAPDAFYCMALLEETGICAVPGSGFGQKEGEAHFRLTCLCEAVEDYMEKFEKFQRAFWKKYRGSEE